MVKILVDTCTWLELAKKPDKIKLLHVINALIDENIISLLVPEPILVELNRNKDRIIKDSNKGLQDAVKKAKLVVEAHGENNSRKAIIEHLDNVGFKIPNLQESSLHIIKTIETLISKAMILPVSDEIILKAAKRAIEKRAPFHRSKNSINDAIIMECYGKEASGSLDGSDQFFFIS